jgi:hypothetical protein
VTVGSRGCRTGFRQTTRRDTMSTALARRLGKIEGFVRADQERRWQAGVEQLRATMDPAHARMAGDWLCANVTGKQIGSHVESPNHICPQCIDRFDPPVLARAVWFLLVEHLVSGAPVALPPDVAEIYLNDPDAFPTTPCEGCGYLLPTQSKLRPDGTYRHIGWYLGACPVCGLDNHPEREEREAFE